MSDIKLLGISGALRAASTNRKLIRDAARLFGPCDYTEADLKMSLYDGDEEAVSGVPEAAQLLARQIAEADAVLIATPEYNKGPSGALKNALDWVSRCDHRPWLDKPVAVMSSAAGISGGVRAQVLLRTYLLPFSARIIAAPEVHVGNCESQFDSNDQLTNESATKALTTLMKNLNREIELLR